MEAAQGGDARTWPAGPIARGPAFVRKQQRRRTMRIHRLAVVLLLAACSSTVSGTGDGGGGKLASDIRAADKPCRDQNFEQKTPLVECLSQHERPVWARDEPRTLGLYDQYAERRAALARQRDAGTISALQYDDQLASTDHEFRERVTAARQQQAATP